MPVRVTKSRYTSRSNLIGSPPICKVEKGSLCLLHYHACDGPEDDVWEALPDIDIDACQQAAAELLGFAGDWTWDSGETDIKQSEDFDNCKPPGCYLDFYDCDTNELLFTEEFHDITEEQCNEHAHDHDPAAVQMEYIDEDGVKDSTNFINCDVIHCHIDWYDCIDNVIISSFGADGINLAACRGHELDVPNRRGQLIWTSGAGRETDELFNFCAPRHCHLDYYDCVSGSFLFSFDADDLSLVECEAHQHDHDPASIALTWTDQDGNITTEFFNSCLPLHCHLDYYNCVDDTLIATYDADGLDLATCEAQQDIHNPARVDLTWTDADGTPTTEEFNHCLTPHCHIEYYDCDTGELITTLDEDGIDLVDCEARLHDHDASHQLLTWSDAAGAVTNEDVTTCCTMHCHIDFTDCLTDTPVSSFDADALDFLGCWEHRNDAGDARWSIDWTDQNCVHTFDAGVNCPGWAKICVYDNGGTDQGLWVEAHFNSIPEVGNKLIPGGGAPPDVFWTCMQPPAVTPNTDWWTMTSLHIQSHVNGTNPAAYTTLDATGDVVPTDADPMPDTIRCCICIGIAGEFECP